MVTNAHRFVRGFYDGFQEFGETIAMVVNTVLLTLLYLVGIGLPSIAARLMGRSFLELHPDHAASSYWKPYPHQPRTRDAWKKPF